MTRKYYSARHNPKPLSLGDLYYKLQCLYLYFRNKDYFKKYSGLTKANFPEELKNEAALELNFQPFYITKWDNTTITEDNIFDTIQFLYDRVSEPGELIDMSENGWNYRDYGSYDDVAGKEKFREKANLFLADYRSGFELNSEGVILAKGTDGLQNILDAEIVPYDYENVDSKVNNAISKWRNRHVSIKERKEAIRELVDVFEWLKKTKGLSKVLNDKDESMIFNIANNFSFRHHNPDQVSNYDHTIWYSWIFHFYLATYHAIIRLLIKEENSKNL